MLRAAVTPCPDAQTLERLLLGCLSGPEAEQLEEHLASCPHCVAHAQTLHPDDPVVRALHGSDSVEPSPHQDLIDAVIPLLKQMRTADETMTLRPRAGSDELADETTAGPAGAITPIDLPGVLGAV